MWLVHVLRMVSERFHRDTEGRPIREGRTPPELLREGEIEYRQCPYAGSRHQHPNPMNVSALRQTSAHWDDVLDALAFLRVAYTGARGAYHANVMDIWRIGQVGSALPWFFILHENATCPAYAAALSKATLGIGIWGHRMVVKAITERRVVERFTSQLMLDTAEDTGTLISDHEVCSAGDKMMLGFFDVFTADTVTVTGAGEVGRLVASRDEILRFGAHYLAFKQWVWLYWLARRFLYRDITAALGERPELVERMDPTGEPPDFFVLEPENVPGLALPLRGQWFLGLANLIEPFAPDGSDAPLRDHAMALVRVMSEEPARSGEIAAEVERVLAVSAEASARVARAIGMFVALDALHGDVLSIVEGGFRGQAGARFDAAARDSTIGMSPREVFAGWAPQMLAALARR
jgi:hypothetical protein